MARKILVDAELLAEFVRDGLAAWLVSKGLLTDAQEPTAAAAGRVVVQESAEGQPPAEVSPVPEPKPRGREAGRVRPDYARQLWLRPPEAALVAGCKVGTIYHHTKDLETRKTLGGLEIKHESLLRHLGRM